MIQALGPKEQKRLNSEIYLSSNSKRSLQRFSGSLLIDYNFKLSIIFQIFLIHPEFVCAMYSQFVRAHRLTKLKKFQEASRNDFL